ncbi:MAG: glycosyltransferase family 39 protein [Burkholderiaceae bacterium]|nr:glycosyltransferase family 39 protein [Burkholderiaceae bacterium]
MSVEVPAARDKPVGLWRFDALRRARTVSRPGRRQIDFTGVEVAAGMVLFAIAWVSLLTYTSLSPPVDNIEQLTWVRSPEWGYYKHPPLPTWLLWVPVQLFGLTAWTSYAMGAAMTLGALAILWRLLVNLRGAAYAGLALLSALCITYYNGRLTYYNHNVVLMFFATASAALCWQAYTTRRLRWWIALGVVIGLGLLSKYQIAVTVASVLAFTLHQQAWRDPVHRVGLLCAALVALLMFVPHIEWLRGHGFGPIEYAQDTSIGVGLGAWARVGNTLGWLVDQLVNRGIPAFALLGITAMELRKLRRMTPEQALSQPASRRDPAKALICAWGVLPLCFMPLVGIATGAELPAHWGTPFLLFAVPAAMELAPRQFWDRADRSKVLCAFLVIQALVMTRDYVTSPHGIPALATRHWRNFNSQEFGQRIADAARAQLGGPVRIVIGEKQMAETLALQLPERPLVLINGNPEISPWLDRGAVERCGAVELGPTESLPGGVPVGPVLPGTSWRVRMPRQGAAPCAL